MDINKKITLFESINCNEILNVELFYDILEKCGDLKKDYVSYMTTNPVDCDTELLRLATADYDLCCALLTMLLREDHFDNGSFEKRQRKGQIKPIIERIINLLSSTKFIPHGFSEKALEALNGYYVYALIDTRSNELLYIGKGIGNRVFSHEIENEKTPNPEKAKHQRIQEIKKNGFPVKKLIINWGLSEAEAFAAEASLINMINYVSSKQLTNIVAGHHAHESLTTEEFELRYGATQLTANDIKHSLMIIKINKLYRRNMTDEELYDTIRGFWKASISSIERRKVKYVLGVYNGLIVAVYRPDEWHYAYEMIDIPQMDILTSSDMERLKNRIYFICKNYKNLDDDGRFYLHKSISNLKDTQSAQNPITYLSPDNFANNMK